MERLLDLVQRLRLHLDERELDVVLDVGLGALHRVQHTLVRVVRPFGSHVADLLLDLLHDLAAALLEDALEFRISIPVHLTAGRLMNAHMNPSFPDDPQIFAGSLCKASASYEIH